MNANTKIDKKYTHPAECLSIIMDRIYRRGLTTTSGGNLSVKKGDEVWITPGGIDKGTLTYADMVRVSKDGVITGKHKPSVELPFHRDIYTKRPDIKSVVHAHPPGLIAFSNVGQMPSAGYVPYIDGLFGNAGFAKYATPGSAKLGAHIADEFKNGSDIVILENHGAVAGGNDIFETFMNFETLEYYARMQIAAKRLGLINKVDETVNASVNHIKSQDIKAGNDYEDTPDTLLLRQEVCSIVNRACNQFLFYGHTGIVSARIGKNSFLITPARKSDLFITADELVAVDNGVAYGEPDASYRLHGLIYESNPGINAVIMASPPSIMAFGISGHEFDSRTIPESYLMLRKVNRVPFGEIWLEQEKTAETLRETRPAMIAENEYFITVGKTLINAFDRLEVAEYSARSIIDSVMLGELRIMNREETDEFNKAFNLPE